MFASDGLPILFFCSFFGAGVRERTDVCGWTELRFELNHDEKRETETERWRSAKNRYIQAFCGYVLELGRVQQWANIREKITFLVVEVERRGGTRRQPIIVKMNKHSRYNPKDREARKGSGDSKFNSQRKYSISSPFSFLAT